MLGDVPPLPQYAFMAWCSVKEHRDNFTLPYCVTRPVLSTVIIKLPLIELTFVERGKNVKYMIVEDNFDFIIFSTQSDNRCPSLVCLSLHMRVYPEVSGLAAWSENCKWYCSLPLSAVVSLFCELV
jgi:hypothetical protein